MTIAKPGNPHGAERATLYKITLKFDQEMYDLLCELERARPNVRGRRSSVIRDVLLPALRAARDLIQN